MRRRQILLILVILVILAAGASIFTLMSLNSVSISKTTQASTSSSTNAETGGNNSLIILTDSMPLPNVGERFDHMSIDVASQLVFIVARGNNSVYVANLITEGVSHIITGLNEPQGIFYVPQYNRLYVSNGGDGTVDVFDVSNYSLIRTLSFSQNVGDADNIRYDSSTGLLYVGYGEENQSGIGIINTSSDNVVGSIPLNGHPESFQIEQNGSRIFINVPTANSIEVADKIKRTVVATWTLSNATENFPMALDEKDHRLFVGFWSPSILSIYDTDTGKLIKSMSMPQDADDLYFDPSSRFIFASCGQGSLYVVRQQNADSYVPLPTLPTAPLARTSLFFPEQEEILVAVPQHNGLAAQLLTFRIRPP